jgi:hypothetical protein
MDSSTQQINTEYDMDDITNTHIFSEQLSKYRPVFLTYSEDADFVTLTHRLDQLPERKTINLLLPRYAKLIAMKHEVDKAIAQSKTQTDYRFSKHLGGRVYVSVCSKYPCVDIRQFYLRDGDLKPLRQGVALHYAEWYFFKLAYTKICGAIPSLAEMQHCSAAHDIENLDEAYACKECFPY